MSNSLAIFLFHRDLRKEDNTGLIYASKNFDKVLPIFIFDPIQIDNKKNKLKSDKCVKFMCDCLKDLDQSIRGNNSKSNGGKLYLFHGDTKTIIDLLVKKLSSSFKEVKVIFNEDYTLFAQKRDKPIRKYMPERFYNLSEKELEDAENKLKANKKLLNEKMREENKTNNIMIFEDYTLTDLIQNPVFTGSSKFYSKYTPYYQRVLKYPIRKADKSQINNWYRLKDKDIKKSIQVKINEINQFYDLKSCEICNYMVDDISVIEGGRSEAQNILRKISSGKFNSYKKDRDFPAKKATTELSAFNKFGCVSIREVYWAMKKAKANDLIREVIWRDFYYQIAYYSPNILDNFGSKTNRNFKPQYQKIKWTGKPSYLKSWKEGQTGFPFADAGMRQMLSTGFMHNRVRMVSASLLIKTLLIDWQEGEKWFAQNLRDYDPSQNNGGWQWTAGTGADSQPYYRIFNQWTQGEKYDPDAKYIKEWIPELKDVDPKDIHKWNEKCNDEKYSSIEYPEPIVDYSSQREEAIKIYKKIK